MRRELNGPFLDALIREDANRAAFLERESDLTADDGMTDYGTAVDRIALLSDGLYRKYKQFIPAAIHARWTLTPWTCNTEHKQFARYINKTGTLDYGNAYDSTGGVSPICYLSLWGKIEIRRSTIIRLVLGSVIIVSIMKTSLNFGRLLLWLNV